MLGALSTKLSRATVASAATINAVADVLYLTGSTQVNTINPPKNGGFDSILFVIPVSGSLIFGTTGNILVGATVAQNLPCTFIWNSVDKKWHIGPIS